jgi:hypothetical protein
MGGRCRLIIAGYGGGWSRRSAISRRIERRGRGDTRTADSLEGLPVKMGGDEGATLLVELRKLHLQARFYGVDTCIAGAFTQENAWIDLVGVSRDSEPAGESGDIHPIMYMAIQ